MSKPLPDVRLNEVVSAVEKQHGGATLLDIAFALNPPAPLRNVQRPLNARVQQNRLVRVGSATAICEKMPPDDVPEATLNSSSDANAIQLSRRSAARTSAAHRPPSRVA